MGGLLVAMVLEGKLVLYEIERMVKYSNVLYSYSVRSTVLYCRALHFTVLQSTLCLPILYCTVLQVLQ